MSFIKNGDNQPIQIISTDDSILEEVERKHKLAEELMDQDTKNIGKDGNKIPSNTDSN